MTLKFDFANDGVLLFLFRNLDDRKRKLIDTADLFIAATAIANKLPFATLNRKHFERIDGLAIIS